MGQIYTKQFLLETLAKNGLPATYKTLMKYEELGIIPKPVTGGVGSAKNWRLYSEEEIQIIVEKVREYVKTWPENIKTREGRV